MAPVLVDWGPLDFGEGTAEVTEGLAEADVEEGPDVEGTPVDVALEELDTEEEVVDDVVEAADEEEGATDDELASVVVLGWTVVEEGGGFDVVGLADVVGAGSDVVGGFAEVVGAGSDVVGGSVVLDVGGLGWFCVVVGSGVVAGLLVTAGLLSEEEPDETAAALGPFPSLFDWLVCDVWVGWESEVVGVGLEEVMEVDWELEVVVGNIEELESVVGSLGVRADEGAIDVVAEAVEVVVVLTSSDFTAEFSSLVAGDFPAWLLPADGSALDVISWMFLLSVVLATPCTTWKQTYSTINKYDIKDKRFILIDILSLREKKRKKQREERKGKNEWSSIFTN